MTYISNKYYEYPDLYIDELIGTLKEQKQNIKKIILHGFLFI